MSEFESAVSQVRAFIIGDMDMAEFVQKLHESDEISRYLEHIIEQIEREHCPVKRRTICMKGVAQNQPFAVQSYAERYVKEWAQNVRGLPDNWKQNPPKVGDHLRKMAHQTAHGAFVLHGTVADIYYQMDSTLLRTEKYNAEYEFSLDVLPGYLAGGIAAENYISQYILPRFPASMKKGERKRLVKEEIKNAFRRDCKGFPNWIQMPEWLIGSDGQPTIYIGQKKFEHHTEYYFRDSATEEALTVRQYW